MSGELTALEAEQLECGCIVYRAVLNKKQMDASKQPRRPTPDLFIPRSRENGADDDGLSVCIASARSAGEFASSFNKCIGIVSLHVGRLRDLGLQVIIDPEDATHALIRGVPYREDEPDQAETLARSLVEQARPVDIPH